jgi:hypothetical protein
VLWVEAQGLQLRPFHPAFGPVLMGQLLATWTTHDHVHLGQITEALAARYAETVGPWRAYLWE